MACSSPLSSISSCPPLRPNSSILNKKPISTSYFSSLIRFPQRSMAASAGLKRYWGTAMRELNLAKMIEIKVAEAMEVCKGEESMRSDYCRVAWDEVEEISSALADLRRRIANSAVDPLEPFCLQNPDAEECRIYED